MDLKLFEVRVYNTVLFMNEKFMIEAHSAETAEGVVKEISPSSRIIEVVEIKQGS